MSANKFILKGSHVEVDYTIGANQAIPALIYKAGAFHKSFKVIEIQAEDTGTRRAGVRSPDYKRRHGRRTFRIFLAVHRRAARRNRAFSHDWRL